MSHGTPKCLPGPFLNNHPTLAKYRPTPHEASMRFTLCTVNADDAELLIRKCDFPAMQDNPLRLIMFPYSCKETAEEEINWDIEGLRNTLISRSAGFRKVCLEDGTPVGFAGWSLEQTTLKADISDSEDVLEDRKGPKKHPKQDYWHPNTLDVEAWVKVSRLLRNEKIRVLYNRKNIWRKLGDGSDV
jgi:hypothetical protein